MARKRTSDSLLSLDDDSEYSPRLCPVQICWMRRRRRCLVQHNIFLACQFTFSALRACIVLPCMDGFNPCAVGNLVLSRNLRRSSLLRCLRWPLMMTRDSWSRRAPNPVLFLRHLSRSPQTKKRVNQRPLTVKGEHHNQLSAEQSLACKRSRRG